MATPAEPILASTLWQSERCVRKRDHLQLKTTISAIDEAVEGCIQYGGITCIHAEEGSGAGELCQALLISHLLDYRCSSATVIDIGSTFDVRHLLHSMLLRMPQAGDAEQEALRVLDRLNIMKIFDFEGLADAVAEIRQVTRQDNSLFTTGNDQWKPSRGTVGDSESDEDLLDTPSPRKVTKETSNTGPSSPLLLISSIQQIISPLIKSNHVQGQSVLVSFMRSLQLLTKAHNLCTIITSGTTTFNKFKEDSPSAFASCKLRPLLGKAFSHLVDAEMLVHQSAVPDRREAAGGREVSVIEVLQNRHGKGVGRWAPFKVDDSGVLKALA